MIPLLFSPFHSTSNVMSILNWDHHCRNWKHSAWIQSRMYKSCINKSFLSFFMGHNITGRPDIPIGDIHTEFLITDVCTGLYFEILPSPSQRSCGLTRPEPEIYHQLYYPYLIKGWFSFIPTQMKGDLFTTWPDINTCFFQWTNANNPWMIYI
jgi:hypothetical protein